MKKARVNDIIILPYVFNVLLNLYTDRQVKMIIAPWCSGILDNPIMAHWDTEGIFIYKGDRTDEI